MGPKKDFWWTHGYIKGMAACARLCDSNLLTDRNALEALMDRLHSEILAATEEEADKVHARKEALQGLTDALHDSDLLPPPI